MSARGDGVSCIFDGLLWLDPSATVSAAVEAVLPAGSSVPATFPCRVVTERRRVMNRLTGVRKMADIRVAHFLLWCDRRGSVTLGSAEARSVFLDAKAHGCDEIVVHGSKALVACRGITFRQFGVRKLTSIPAATGAPA